MCSKCGDHSKSQQATQLVGPMCLFEEKENLHFDNLLVCIFTLILKFGMINFRMYNS